MLDLLMILPYTDDGRSIDWATDWVMNAEDAGVLPQRAKTRMAQGVAQALDALSKDAYRSILIVKPEQWGSGTSLVWDQVESQRLFDKARVCFATNWAQSTTARPIVSRSL